MASLGPFRADDATIALLKKRAERAGETLTAYLIRRGSEEESDIQRQVRLQATEIDRLREDIATRDLVITYLDKCLDKLAERSSDLTSQIEDFLIQRKKVKMRGR